MPLAIVLGVSGAVGASAATALVEQGWDVVGTGRDDRRFPARLQGLGVRFVRSDRHINADVASVLASGADLVVDCVGYTAAHARMVLEHRFDIGSVVFVSSKAVYVDERGRHSNTLEQPDFGGPIHESQPTLDPSDEHYDSPTGYGANKVAAELAYLNSDLQCSVLRPSRVHGVDATNPREWVFVKRALDGRRRLPLARRGAGVNHPTAAVNLAALIATCAARPGTRVLNSADPDAPSGRAIAQAIGEHLIHAWDEILLDETAPDGLGDHPWNSVPPIVLDTTSSLTLGYVPVGSYAETVRATVDWLVDVARSGKPDEPCAGSLARYLDYPREDALLDLWRG